MYGIIGGLASVRAMRQPFFTSGRPKVLVATSVPGTAVATLLPLAPQEDQQAEEPHVDEDDDDVADGLVRHREREAGRRAPWA